MDAPTPPMVQVAGIVAVEYQSFAPGGSPLYTFAIEAAISRINDVAAQRTLWELMEGGSADLKAAVEADRRLTSRLLDDETVDISQEPACDDLEVIFQGQGRFVDEGGNKLLLGTWHARVLT